jgi:hypothetical protein
MCIAAYSIMYYSIMMAALRLILRQTKTVVSDKRLKK